MGKMYYSEPEALEKLGVSAEELQRMVEEGKLAVYMDGPRRMYKAEQVDGLAGDEAGGDDIELVPADTSAGQEASLAQADQPPAEKPKEDTVITSEGISIFDDEDLELETDDPMAKTTVAPSVEEEILMEGVGGGSGLTRLAEEKDDTSLGDALDQIPEADFLAGEAVEEIPEEQPPEVPVPGVGPQVLQEPTLEEAVDPTAGVFSGLLLTATVLMLLVGAVVVAVMMDKEPPYLDILSRNVTIVLLAGLFVAVVTALAGYFIGKSVARQAEALRAAAGQPSRT